jgi:AcrR family transcriptional regulator
VGGQRRAVAGRALAAVTPRDHVGTDGGLEPSRAPGDVPSGIASGDGASETGERRAEMLRAALAVIGERGFGETRIADVAARAGVSPALLIYYFRTKDGLLSAAMAYAEDCWYEVGARRMAGLRSAAERLEEIVAMSCLPEADFELPNSWSVWLDLWAQAAHHPEVAAVREEFDERWRETIRSIVREGQSQGEFIAEVDVDEFAISFSALLDGLAIQVALNDPVVDAQRAFVTSMVIASERLGFDFIPPGRSRRSLGLSADPAGLAPRREKPH